MKSSTKKSLKRRVKSVEKSNRDLDNRLRLLEAIVSAETAQPPAEGEEPDEAPATVPAEGEDELSDDDSEETSE